ncbi:alpha amylase, catalytic domain protein, partial [Vibrio parahaemolyticus VPTS-2010]
RNLKMDERRSVQALPECDDDCGRVNGVSGGVCANLYGWFRFWLQVEYGVDARQSFIHQRRSCSPQIPPQYHHIPAGLCAQRELRLVSLSR